MSERGLFVWNNLRDSWPVSGALALLFVWGAIDAARIRRKSLGGRGAPGKGVKS